MTLSQARKAANNAPKYGLYQETLGWLANKQPLFGDVVFTQEKELAMQYAEGFDNVDLKLAVWNVKMKMMFNCDITFEAVSL